jgi:dienelactone hydrolase
MLRKRSLLFPILLILVHLTATAQRKVTFSSKDGLTVTADLYETDPEHPWIVLFHQPSSSRGEYRDIAPRLNKLNMNCMAVDLRSGKEKNFRVNETAALAKDAKLSTDFIHAEKDMRAAIERAYGIGRRPVIILGSSYSASLALKLAKEMDEVMAVVAFSPGEFFENKLNVQEAIAGLGKPTFISGAASERKWIEELASGIPKGRKITYIPGAGGAHGASCLLKSTEGQTEYWIQLINFLQTVKKDMVR